MLYLVRYTNGHLSRGKIRRDGTIYYHIGTARKARDEFEGRNDHLLGSGRIVAVVKGVTHVIE